MKQGPLTYKYAKQLNGRGRYAAVTIEIVQHHNGTIVTDNCAWKTFKEAYPDFVELDILKTWKQSAVSAAKEIIYKHALPGNLEIIVKDIMGLYADTCPSHIGAAIIIGIFDYCGSTLDDKNLQLLDEFVGRNNEIAVVPNYSQLHLSIHKST